MLNDPFDSVKIGNDDDEATEEGVEIVRLTEGVRGPQAVMIPTSMRRKLDDEGMLLVGDIQHAVRQITKLQNFLDTAVDDARAQGMSWATIGWTVGLTAEGARKKWSEPDED